jgi:hypothetical protein
MDDPQRRPGGPRKWSSDAERMRPYRARERERTAPLAVLWVVPENERARALYDSEGWVAGGGVSTEEILGVTVSDIRYRKPLAASPPHA